MAPGPCSNFSAWERFGRGRKRKTHLPDSLLAVGWKLFLACYQFLTSPKAHVVDFIVGVVDLVEVMRMVARDNITANRLANCAGKGNGKSLVAAPMRPENQEGIENKRLTPDGVPQTSGCFKKKAGAGEAGFGFL